MPKTNDEYKPELSIVRTLSQFPDGIDIDFIGITRTKSATNESIIPSNELLTRISSSLMPLVEKKLIKVKGGEIYRPRHVHEIHRILYKEDRVTPEMQNIEKAALIAVDHYGSEHGKYYTEGHTMDDIITLFTLAGFSDIQDIMRGLSLALYDKLIENVKNPNGSMVYVLTQYGGEELKRIAPELKRDDRASQMYV